MCVNYEATSRQLTLDLFGTSIFDGEDWREEIYQDYPAPILVHDQAGERRGIVASYGMLPKRKMPPGQRLTTMNARAETVGQLRTYRSAWGNGQLCLVPMTRFFEPNWEQAQHVRWSIGMADGSPFAVAGLYRNWDEEDGSRAYSFTQLTINADEHPLMKRFHRPGDEKRSLVVIPREHYDGWLACRNPELARAFLLPYQAELMAAEPAPKTVQKKQADLF